MVRKRFLAARTKKKAPPRVGRPVVDGALSGAHPRLIHGFLVRGVVKPSDAAAAKAAPAAASASTRPHGPFPAATKHEGPSDDSTFH
jgi:hypothetical protein